MAAMTVNRTVPTDIVVPHIAYQDIEAAIAWLTRVFGFREHFRYGEPVSGAQMFASRACLMIHGLRDGSTPAQLGFGTQSLTIFVDDVDKHYAHAKAAGAQVVEEPHETVYGEYQYAAIDLDGHHWLFSRHARDLSPTDWGATIAAH